MINDLLDKKRANEIIGELRERNYMTAQILEYLKSLNITESKDMLKIIDTMLQNEPYYNFFIGNNFVNYAEPDEKFFDLILKLSRIERFGYNVSNLGKLYEDNSNTVNFLYEKLKPLDEYRIALTAGYI